MRRKPRKPGSKELKMPMMQCMTSTAHRLVEGSDQGSLCFLKCHKEAKTDGHHPCEVTPTDMGQYPWELNSTRRKCTCRHCKSNCSKRFRISNFQHIALQLIAKNQHDISKGERSGKRRLWITYTI